MKRKVLFLFALLVSTMTSWATPEGTAITTLPDGATDGTYYLTQDIEVTEAWNVTADITLDLNGHLIKWIGDDTGSIISIGSSDNPVGNLTLKDSDPTTVHYFTATVYASYGGVSLWSLNTEATSGTNIEDLNDFLSETTVIAVKGGCITGSQQNQILQNYGTFTMQGGNIVGNFLAEGDVICNNSGATMTISGGLFCGNYAFNIITNNGNLTFSGGRMAFNTTSYAGAILNDGTKENIVTVTMSGNATIDFNINCANGALFNSSYAKVDMTGGFIQNNKSINQRGLGNLGAGVTIISHQTSNLTVGGTAVIADNKYNDGETEVASDIVAMATGAITISSTTPLASGANIGFEFYSGVEGAVTTNGTADDLSYFYANSGQTLYYFNGAIRAYSSPTVNLTGNAVDDAYWCTYYNSNANYQADANTTIYTISNVSGTTATLSPVSNKIIKAGQAVILKSTQSSITLTYTTTAATDADYTSNLLKGFDVVSFDMDESVIASITISTSAYASKVIYTLAEEDDVLGFFKYYDNVSATTYTTNTTLAANKAFLALDAAAAARGFVFQFEEDVTGIQSLTPDPSPKGEGSSYYSLDGRKLNGKPTQKGLYIVNGKKIIVR